MIAPWGYLSHVPGYRHPLPSPYPLLYPWRNVETSGPPWMAYPMMPPNQEYYQSKSVRTANANDPWVQVYRDLQLEADTGIISEEDS